MYKILISPTLFYLFGGGCKFTPSCSTYAIEAIKKHGMFKGGKLALVRILKCHPFNSSSYFDPVPNL